MVALRAAMEDYGSGAELEDCPALARLVCDHETAQSALAPLIARLVRLQRDHPLAALGLRHRAGVGCHTLELIARARARLSLTLVTAEGAVEAPKAAVFVDCERSDMVLAGRASITHFSLPSGSGGNARIGATHRQVAPGDCIRCTGPGATVVIRTVEPVVLLLRLERRAAKPRPTCSHAVPSGTLRDRVSGDSRESRLAMMAMLLGRMGRRDAVPVLAVQVLDQDSRGASARWAMLRECLALDPAAGWSLLQSIAQDQRDELARAARALSEQLAHTHPQLANQDLVPCRA